jgi:ribosomal protein L11 methyltransferase
MDTMPQPELWRAIVRTTGPEMPDILEGFEHDALLSAAVFEIEDETAAEPLGWQVDLLFRERPEPEALETALAGLCAVAGARLDGIEIAEVPAADWTALTQLRLPPIPVGRFVVHGAHARGALPAGLMPIEIDAGLAFGSGEHATTSSCLLALDRLARRHRFRRVLDVGCGSGVLAIAAAKCWPARVLAVDNDPVAVRVATANAGINGVARHIRVALADGYRHALIRRHRPFDLILANILADPLIEMAPALRCHLAPGGHAVLSGLLDRQAAAVAAAHVREGLQLVARIDQGPWTALVLRLGRRRRSGVAPW